MGSLYTKHDKSTWSYDINYPRTGPQRTNIFSGAEVSLPNCSPNQACFKIWTRHKAHKSSQCIILLFLLTKGLLFYSCLLESSLIFHIYTSIFLPWISLEEFCSLLWSTINISILLLMQLLCSPATAESPNVIILSAIHSNKDNLFWTPSYIGNLWFNGLLFGGIWGCI